MTQDLQTLRQGMPTLHGGDLLSIVKAREGWFHPEVVVIAREELDRRGVTIPTAESAGGASITDEESASKDGKLPSWIWSGITFFGFVCFKELLHLWIPVDWASSLALVALFVVFYWQRPVEERKTNRAKGLFVYFIAVALNYLVMHFWAR